jgi:DNA-dependent protein kinase catalytic subunit
MPDWMKNLHNKMSNPDTHLNVRLFIARVILNSQNVFRPYAALWFQTLVDLATSMAALNYFANDIVVTLLSWHDVAVPEVRTFSVSINVHTNSVFATGEHCGHCNDQPFGQVHCVAL